MFGGSLFARWVTARQAVSADPADTVARLLGWMARDQYGFWSHAEDDIASALDEAGSTPERSQHSSSARSILCFVLSTSPSAMPARTLRWRNDPA
jgi:hypothetical protein